MKKRIPVKIEEPVYLALKEQAEAEQLTLSDFIQQLLNDYLAEKTFLARAGHLKGSTFSPELDDEWRKSMRSTNWRE